jgi:renalase
VNLEVNSVCESDSSAARNALKDNFLSHDRAVSITDVLIVGAGLSGLSAARDLEAAGFKVGLVEKSRGAGGRAATRRWEAAVLDHGAPFFTVRGERLKQLVSRLMEAGVLRVWTRGFHAWENGVLTAPEDSYPRYVGVNGMSALGKALAAGVNPGDAPLHVETGALVTGIAPSSHGWDATLDGGEIISARAVLVTTPAPQALALTRAILEPETQLALERVKFEACWALLALLETAPDVDWKGVKLKHPVLEWAGLEHTKRESAPSLVLHANASWSAAHLEQSPEEIVLQLLEAMRGVFGDALKVSQLAAHRWRYARSSALHPAPILKQDNLIFCGDWCDTDGHGTRIENAIQSGWAAASQLKQQLQQQT